MRTKDIRRIRVKVFSKVEGSTSDTVAAKPGLFTEMLLMQFKANITNFY